MIDLRTMDFVRCSLPAVGLVVALSMTSSFPSFTVAGEPAVDFRRDIQPLLRDRCFECHSAGNEEGGLNLSIRQRAMAGGDHGPVLLPGNSAQSALLQRISATDTDQAMPPEGPAMTPEQVALVRRWVDEGAVWPDDADQLDPRIERAHRHWAFQKLHAVPLPDTKQTDWVRTPIDRFVLARLEANELIPSARASDRHLIRRLSYDLIGLPPSPADVEAFSVAATVDRDRALDELIDRLLTSTHYGERWGRHWLDVARYADSDGQESDRDRPSAYHYRDFVIAAFNDDMPFDQFVRWQLAGNEYEPDNPQAVAATGFLAAGPFAALPDNLMEDERLRNRYNELDDILSTVGTGLMGLTLGCARCHDHKYDAIPARDYYSLLSAFHSGERGEMPLGNTDQKVLGYHDLTSEPQPTWLFRRANYYDHEQPVSLGFLSLFGDEKAPAAYLNEARQQGRAAASTYQRRALAEWMTDVEHGAGPLVARVIVNRIWMHHFDQGLVRTSGDFGVRSDPPTHPELLEWLAHDFVTHGWRIKRLQKMIVQSAVYLQTSSVDAAPRDPDNRLLSRMPLRRLEGEVVRDALLEVSGTLNRAAGGPAVRPPIAPEAILARNLKDGYPDDLKDGPDVRRRSIYLFHKRVVPYPLLQAFDKPDAQQSCSRRDRTTVAPQALALLNDPFVRTVAGDFADRLLRQADATSAEQVDLAFRLALGRAATRDELSSASQFINQQQESRLSRDAALKESEAHRQALADFCQVIFGLNEFVYVD